MRQQLQAFVAEIAKNKHAKITWISFLAFSLAPIFGAVFMLLMKGSGYEGLSGAFRSKAVLLSFTAHWASYLGLLSQAVGVGGIIIFGFAMSWLFGREYSDGTAKDLLALPISRAKMLNAKFIYYAIWCFALALANLLLGLLLGLPLHLPGWSADTLLGSMQTYFITTLLVVILDVPIAFFASSGKGYLAPLGVVVVLVVLAQIMGALGYGSHFPWSVPGIYSGSGGNDLKSELDAASYLLLFLTGIVGYFGTILWWKYADQTK